MEGFRLGPVATQFRDLNEQFDALREEADRLGISTAGLAEEQAKANAALSREIQSQGFQVAGAVGAMSDLDVQLNLLNLEMQEFAARAQELGVPLTNISQQHNRLAQALVQQHQAATAVTVDTVDRAAEARERQRQFFQAANTVGAMSDLNTQLHLLNVDMQEAAARARELGVPLSKISQQHVLLAQALVRQNRAQRLRSNPRSGISRRCGPRSSS